MCSKLDKNRHDRKIRHGNFGCQKLINIAPFGEKEQWIWFPLRILNKFENMY